MLDTNKVRRVVLYVTMFPNPIVQIHIVHRHFRGSFTSFNIWDKPHLASISRMISSNVSCRCTMGTPSCIRCMCCLVFLPFFLRWFNRHSRDWRGVSVSISPVFKLLGQSRFQNFILFCHHIPWIPDILDSTVVVCLELTVLLVNRVKRTFSDFLSWPYGVRPLRLFGYGWVTCLVKSSSFWRVVCLCLGATFVLST